MVTINSNIWRSIRIQRTTGTKRMSLNDFLEQKNKPQTTLCKTTNSYSGTLVMLTKPEQSVMCTTKFSKVHIAELLQRHTSNCRGDKYEHDAQVVILFLKNPAKWKLSWANHLRKDSVAYGLDESFSFLITTQPRGIQYLSRSVYSPRCSNSSCDMTLSFLSFSEAPTPPHPSALAPFRSKSHPLSYWKGTNLLWK